MTHNIVSSYIYRDPVYTSQRPPCGGANTVFSVVPGDTNSLLPLSINCCPQLCTAMYCTASAHVLQCATMQVHIYCNVLHWKCTCNAICYTESVNVKAYMSPHPFLALPPIAGDHSRANYRRGPGVQPLCRDTTICYHIAEAPHSTATTLTLHMTITALCTGPGYYQCMQRNA